MVDNLADALEAFFRGKGLCLTAAATVLSERTNAKEAGKDRDPAPPSAYAVYQGKRRHPRPERWRERQAQAAAAEVARRREKYDQARALHARGATVAAIARTVGVGRRTVYRYLRDPPPQRKRRSDYGQHRMITPFEPYLLKCWSEGCQTATVLWRKIQAQGFAFSVSNVQRFVAELRREGASPTGHAA